MALVQTLLTPLSRTDNTTLSGWTTGSTTVPANSTVVYIVSGCSYNTSTALASNFTLTTSAAGTPTVIGNSGASSSWGYGHKAFYVVNSTGSDISTTLTVGISTGDTMGSWVITPIQYTGISSSTPFTGFVTGIAAGNAAQTLTLSAAPTSGDYTLGALMGIVNDGSTYTATVGSGYTQASTSSDIHTECYTSVQYRTGSTSTAAGWTNTGKAGSTAAAEVQSIGFNVKAATASPPVLTSGTTSNIQTTTATVGATTDTASGTMYAVVYTGTTPTATQIKAGQNSSGTTTPSANIAISSTGAKTLNITGLTANTAYNYSIVHNSTNGDSNIISGTLTTLAVPVLSSPTSASITQSGATVGATTTVGAGTLYAVVYTGTQPTAAQIKAGQNSSGTTTPSGTVAVSSTGAKTIAISGLSASTAYNYALVQNDGTDSNVVTGTFTTSSPSPATLTSPTSSSVAATTATVGATTDTGSGTLYAVVYTGSTPTASQIKLGQNSSGTGTPSGNVTVASSGAKTINITGLTAGTAYNYALVQNSTGGDSNVVTGTFTTVSVATLTTPASSSVTATTASVGATSDKSGTMYVVCSTTNSTPTATQIKAGQNAAGTTVPSANGSAVSGANLLSISGLTASTTYYYFVLVNNVAGDSNIVTSSFTTGSVGTPTITLKQYWLKPWLTTVQASLQSPYNTTPLVATAGSTLLVVSAGWDGTRQIPLPTDTAGTFTLVSDGTTTALSHPNQMTIQVAAQANATGGNHTISVPAINDGTNNGDQGELGVWIFEILNMPSTLTVRNVTVNHSTRTTKPWSGSTGSQPQIGDFVLAMSTYENTAASTTGGLSNPPTGGWTALALNDDASTFIPTSIAYRIVSSAGVQTATWTCTDSAKSEDFEIMVTLVPASSTTPILSSPTSSNVLTTSATVGATTDTASGTLYAVAYTGSQPTAAQIKAGQNSSGATTPSGTLSVTSAGAKTINLTGLSAGTAYNYALVHNITAGDSNIVTGTFTTSAAGATPAPVGTATVFSISTGTTATGTRTVASGSAVFLIVQNASSISSVQSGATNWNAVKSQINTDSGTYRSSLYSLTNVAGGSLSVTVTQASSGFMQCTLIEYSHMGSMTVAATAGNGTFGSNQGTGSTGTLPSGSNLLAVATWYASATSGGTITPPSGWTNWTSATNPVYLVCGQVVSSTTALNPTWTYSGGTVENANLIAVFTPGAAPPAATLSSPASNTVTSTTANVTCTSDTASGSIYAIASTSSTTPTASQIEGGLNGTGAAASATGSVVAAVGTNTISFTGLTSNTTYYYWLVQDNGSFSNVVGGSSFTTPVPSPVISSTNTATPIVGGSITLTGTTFNSPQSTGTLVITDGFGGTASETGLTWSNTSITVPSISLGTNILGTVYLTVTNSHGDASNNYSVTLGPQSGWTLVTIGTPNSTASSRLTATGGGDLASGDQVIYGNIQGTGNVTVNTDGTWVADPTVTSFDYAVGVAGFGYGSTGTETLNSSLITTTVVCVVWFG